MTPHDALVLAHTSRCHRRLRLAVIAHLLGRPTDIALPPRLPDEPMSAWLHRLSSLDARSPAIDAAADRRAVEALGRAAALGIAPLALGAADYPRLLAEVADPPPLLWLRGAMDDLRRPGVALVGSRAASSYGLGVARRFAHDLAAAGIVVVSGLARGIDSAAHEAALAAGGRTVAVLGSAHDRLYPPEHAELARRIEGAGAVVSELPPGTPPRAHHFPLRNRIISGLVSAVVVVEAPEKSGALITASCALDQSRDVLVVPGPVTGNRNRGGHALLRDGAKLAESADDILEEIGRPARWLDEPESPRSWLSQLPEGVDFTVDEVAQAASVPAADVLAGLLELELAGRVRRVGGGRFVRSSGAC